MRLQIDRKLQTTVTDSQDQRGLTQTSGNVYVINKDGDVVYEAMSLERPRIRKIPSVSRLPAGTYQYKIVNKTPKCPFSFIRILDTKFDIKQVDDYVDSTKAILVGSYLTTGEGYINMGGQREALTEICKLLPEEGQIKINDDTEKDIRKKVRAQIEAEYESQEAAQQARRDYYTFDG